MLESILAPIAGFFSFLFTVFWICVGVLLVILIIRYVMRNKHAEDTVAERWGTMLAGQADKADLYLHYVEEAMRAKKLPYQMWRQQIACSFTSTECHEFTVSQLNSDYSAFISGLPQGTDLTVNWLLQDHMVKGIYKLPVVGRLLLGITKRHSFAMTNKVRAFATETYSCAIEAAERILDEAKQDKSKLNRQTSGKLGPL